MLRRSSFGVTLSTVITAYLAVATAMVDNSATTPADQAAVTVLGVLTGAVGISALALFIRWTNEPDEDSDRVRLPVGYRPLDEHGELSEAE